jgi:hypothetical protein
LVTRSRFAIGGQPCGFSIQPSRRGVLFPRQRSLLGLRSPSKFLPPFPSRHPQVPTPLMRFVPLQHIRDRRSVLHGLCLPATVRPQGLTSLSTVSSLRARARHVSAKLRSWGFPFGAFLSREVTRPLGRAEPTRRCRHSPLRSKPHNVERPLGLWAFTPARARCQNAGV